MKKSGKTFRFGRGFNLQYNTQREFFPPSVCTITVCWWNKRRLGVADSPDSLRGSLSVSTLCRTSAYLLYTVTRDHVEAQRLSGGLCLLSLSLFLPAGAPPAKIFHLIVTRTEAEHNRDNGDKMLIKYCTAILFHLEYSSPRDRSLFMLASHLQADAYDS